MATGAGEARTMVVEIALAILAIVGLSLGYGLHGILLLRWCGRWSQNRRLVLWISQMLLPFTTGAVAAIVGEAVSWAVIGYPPSLDWTSTWVDAGGWALWLAPAMALVAAAFLAGPASVLLGLAPVWVVGLLGVATGSGASFLAAIWSSDENTATLAGIAGWHVGVLGAPLAMAWRVRSRRRLALGGRACLDCGYDLEGVTLDRCPECGATRMQPRRGEA